MNIRPVVGIGCLAIGASVALASGHGPVFGMATPTNVRGGFSFDVGLMGRTGVRNTGVMLRGMLGYGITEDVQLSLSAPVVLSSAPLQPARTTAMMPASSDLEAIGAWRFHRKGTAVGTRVETTGYLGLMLPGPQRPSGMLGSLKRAPGVYTAVATGIASRSHYVWGGIGNLHYANREGDQRPNVFTYSAVWGYRPPMFQKEYPHWDWRFLAEMTGDKGSLARRGGHLMPGTNGHQVFLGPGILGIYRNYAVQGGIQFPVYRDVGLMWERERFRFAVNLSYFF